MSASDGGPPAWDFESELVRARARAADAMARKAPAKGCRCSTEAGLKSVVSGAITHTPDCNFLSVRRMGARNYWMANGASIGICQGAGAGKYLAQWMVHGQAEINMREFDPRRFGDVGRRRLCEGYRHRGLSSHVLLLQARRAACGGPAGAPVEPVRASRRGRGAVPAGHGLGASALVRQKRCGRALFLPPQQLVGRRCARNAWRCATRSGSWTCRPSPNSSSGAPARRRCCRVSAPTAFPAAMAASCSPIC